MTTFFVVVEPPANRLGSLEIYRNIPARLELPLAIVI
jgi:hypothetical protein